MSDDHTPGPWYIAFPQSVYAMADCKPVAECANEHRKFVEHSANARLIAAAPELLEALTAIRDMWPAHGTTVQNATADAMANRARAALAKVSP